MEEKKLENNIIEVLNNLHKKEKHQEIIDKIEALPSEEMNPEIIGILARAYNNVDNYEKALELLKSIEEYEKDTNVWNYRIGYSYYYLDNYLEAKKHFLKAIEIDPTDSDSHLFLCWIYQELTDKEKDNSEQIIKYLNKSIECANIYSKLEPEESIKDELIFAEERLGWAYDRLNNFIEGEKHLRKAIELGDNDKWVYSQLGYTLRFQDRYEEALENYMKSVELGRNDTWIYSEIAWTYFSLEKFSEALEYINKAKELSPVEVDLLLISRTSSILIALGKHTEAIKLLENDKYKNDAILNCQIGWNYGELEKPKEALKYLFKAEKLGKDDRMINID